MFVTLVNLEFGQENGTQPVLRDHPLDRVHNQRRINGNVRRSSVLKYIDQSSCPSRPLPNSLQRGINRKSKSPAVKRGFLLLEQFDYQNDGRKDLRYVNYKDDLHGFLRWSARSATSLLRLGGSAHCGI